VIPEKLYISTILIILLEALLKAEAEVIAVKDQCIQLLREKNDG